MRIAFVVQRYGEEINGGSELHCRWIAERLADKAEVEVLTTCAKDYVSWKNEYVPGTQRLNGVTIRRFPTDFPRDILKFNQLTTRLLSQCHSEGEELDWMKKQGPHCQALLDYLSKNKEKHALFIFFTYLYFTTFFGLPIVADKSLLVPTAHDEPPVYLDIFKKLFLLPKAILFNTKEEKEFINRMFHNNHILSEIVGVGVNVSPDVLGERFLGKYGINEDFILYVGRIEEGKGCKELFEYFSRYNVGDKLKLVLLGNPWMPIPQNPDIISLGFVSEKDKFDAIDAAKLVVIPSKFESLSMITLESWFMGKPVLANGNCEVLKGHCLRSNAGLYYTNYDEFAACLKMLLSNEDLRRKMGENGQGYVKENYSWEIIEKKYLNIFKKLINKNET